MLTGSSPILATLDVPRTIQYYTDVLGFPSSWKWGDPPTFGAASWGKVTIMFSESPELASRIEGHEHWISVDDINELHAQHLERGAIIVSAIEDKPWGRREYTVRDPNGYYLRFTGDPMHVPRGSGVLPAGVAIERRKPTIEEYCQVIRSAFDKESVPEGVIERTWGGVVAATSTGDVIGTVRIMFDAPGWFSIWDVGVVPDWQGRRIGSAMMEAALEIVREESPGAIVYLFTYNHEFYKRLGFEEESVSAVRL